jgi:hypothetical protein
MGKTALIEATRARLEREGVHVVALAPRSDEQVPGVDAVADAVCELLVRTPTDNPATHAAAIRRAQVQVARDERHLPRMMLQLLESMRAVLRARPVVFWLDDAHLVPEAAVGKLTLSLRGLTTAGCPVVMAVRTPCEVRRLLSAADEIVDLAPLGPAGTAALLARELGRPAEPMLVSALRGALGTSAGNPAAVLTAVRTLGNARKLAVIDGRVCLAEPETEIRLPVGAEEPASSAVLPEITTALALLTDGAQVRVDDLFTLAPTLGRSTDEVGRALDTLVENGTLIVRPDGSQHVTFAVPALAAALRPAGQAHEAAALHARIVQAAVDRAGPAAAGMLDPGLADHALATGALLDDSAAVDLLLAAANTAGTDRELAIRAAQGALLRLPADDERQPGAVRDVLGLMAKGGDRTGLLALGRLLLSRFPGDLGDMAELWTLALLDERRYVGDPAAGVEADHDTTAAVDAAVDASPPGGSARQAVRGVRGPHRLPAAWRRPLRSGRRAGTRPR